MSKKYEWNVVDNFNLECVCNLGSCTGECGFIPCDVCKIEMKHGTDYYLDTDRGRYLCVTCYKKEPEPKLQNLAKTLGSAFNVKLDITLRGEKEFTLSFDGQNDRATAKIKKYFKSSVKSIETLYDEECDATFIYLEA